MPTLAFNLDAKYIIHAVVPKWIDGEHNEYDLLSAAYLSALNIAEVLGCKTVAFPLLASGNNGFDLALAFEIAKESIESFSGTCLQKVYVVIYGNRISGVVKEKGFTIYELPPNLRKLELKAVHQEKVREFAEGGRDAVLRFMEAQIDKALIYLKDPNNVERAISMGIRIATAVIKAAKK